MASDVMLIVIICLFIAVVYLCKKIRQKDAALRKKQSDAHQMGANQAKGDMYQILGTFSVLAEYEQVGFVATTSKQISIDMIGISDDRIDFVEFKKSGADLRPSENRLRRLVEAGHVYYQVKDVELPRGLDIKDRTVRQ